MTEIYRNCRFRLFPVTEINRSPYRGADVFGGYLRGLAMLCLFVLEHPRNLPVRLERIGPARMSIRPCERQQMKKAGKPELARVINQQAHMLAAQSFRPHSHGTAGQGPRVAEGWPEPGGNATGHPRRWKASRRARDMKAPQYARTSAPARESNTKSRLKSGTSV